MGEFKNVISGLKKAAGVGNAMKKLAGGRKSIITPEEDRYILPVAKSAVIPKRDYSLRIVKQFNAYTE